MQDSVYLGTEKVGRLLGKFALPCIFSLIISCLYNIVDQIFVGNGVGYLGNAILGSFLGGVVIIAIGYTWGDGLLQLIGATGQNLSLAHDYGFIIYAMMPLALVQNTLASIIRAEGEPPVRYGSHAGGRGAEYYWRPGGDFCTGYGDKGSGLGHDFRAVCQLLNLRGLSCQE